MALFSEAIHDTKPGVVCFFAAFPLEVSQELNSVGQEKKYRFYFLSVK